MQVIHAPKHGDVLDALSTMYPAQGRFYTEGDDGRASRCDTTFGYVLSGYGSLVDADGITWPLAEGLAFSVTGSVGFRGDSENFALWTVFKPGFRGLTQFVKREGKGRLSYIDGCSDTCLIQPARLGDPCLNHLHFPPGINQTQHTHPSIRMGCVVEGEGVAFQMAGDGREGWQIPLTKGCFFLLPEQEIHSFKTKGEGMDVIAWHPDSDTGPTDENHAMINRTLINHGGGK